MRPERPAGSGGGRNLPGGDRARARGCTHVAAVDLWCWCAGRRCGSAAATVKAGWRPGAPIIVNSSLAIIYASSGDDFAEAARREAIRTQDVLQAARGSSQPPHLFPARRPQTAPRWATDWVGAKQRVPWFHALNFPARLLVNARHSSAVANMAWHHPDFLNDFRLLRQ